MRTFLRLLTVPMLLALALIQPQQSAHAQEEVICETDVVVQADTLPRGSVAMERDGDPHPEQDDQPSVAVHQPGDQGKEHGRAPSAGRRPIAF